MRKDHEDPKITIIDFGASDMFKSGSKMNEKHGTPFYVAPEVLYNNYDEKCDVWSIGVITFILLSGYPPFDGLNDEQIAKAVKNGTYKMDAPEWLTVTSDAKDFVEALLTYNPQ